MKIKYINLCKDTMNRIEHNVEVRCVLTAIIIINDKMMLSTVTPSIGQAPASCLEAAAAVQSLSRVQLLQLHEL